MLKSSLLITALLLINITLNGQSRGASAVYIELGGNGGLYSLNYDRLLNEDFGLRGGLMLFAFSDGSAGAAALAIPVLANYFIGDGNHRLELGAGFTYLTGAVGGSDVFGDFSGISPTASIGYRYQPRDGGFFFKAAFTPFILPSGFQSWGGVGLGYTF